MASWRTASTVRSRRPFRGGMVAALVVACVLAGSAVSSLGAGSGATAEPPDGRSIVKGERLFAAKGCANCHAVWGSGASDGIGPDLGSKSDGWPDVMRLAGTMWNHMPAMWEEIREHRVERTTFSPEEMGDLFTFLFFVKFIGPPGDPMRGRQVFESKLCQKCHQVGGRGGTVGPRLDDLREFASAFLLARALWNHGPRMAEEMDRLGLQRPDLDGADVSDLVAWMRGEGRTHGELERVLTEAGNPRRGEIVFQRGSCAKCHAIAGSGGKIGPDLASPSSHFDVTQATAAFWNHGPAMRAAMRREGLTSPQFNYQEMSDLLTYLAFIRYVGFPGDAAEGAKLFERKSCSVCHRFGSPTEGTAPDLARSGAAASVPSWTAAMWNHGPDMQAKLRERGLAWPRFAGDEMRNVVAFVRSRMAKNEDKP